jgi:beta-xylosidase
MRSGGTTGGGGVSTGGVTGTGGGTRTGGTGSNPDGGGPDGVGTGGTGGNGTAGGTSACTPPAAGSKGKNPLFTDVYTADPAAFVYNCTFYINCGHDEGGGTGFVMNNWFILKSTDMVSWTRINNALAISAFKWSDGNAWAGQMVTKGGKFYWYVPINKIGSCPNNCGMAIGVAVGDSPEGPFKDALGKPLIDDVFEMSNMGFTLDSDTPYTIDPTVYVDDDGKAYMHYGSFGRVVHVDLGDDMISVSGKMKEINLGSISASDGKTSFFESSYLTKRNGKWYEIYAAGSNPAAINYSTADKPDGPWTGKGRIIDPLPTTSADGATNHAGVAEFAGQWYIVYHVSNGPNGGGTYHREVAIDKLSFNADGTIQKVTPSSGLTF